jgi:methylmalonyl-CoA/ethylmalonyl-CoA epimerase
MWVDDLELVTKKAIDAGATYFGGRPDNNPNTFYEVKYKTPDGVIFDLTHNGWRGAVKEVVPAETEKAPAE